MFCPLLLLLCPLTPTPPLLHPPPHLSAPSPPPHTHTQSLTSSPPPSPPYLSVPRRQTDVFEILSADIGAVQEVTVRLVGVNKCGELLGVLVGEGTKLGGRWRGLLVGGLLDALV